MGQRNINWIDFKHQVGALKACSKRMNRLSLQSKSLIKERERERERA